METKVDNDVLVVEKNPKPRSTPDLSAEIAGTIQKGKGERVRVTRVYGDNYRCNWLALDDGLEARRGTTMPIETYRIRDSKFLRVTKAEGKLTIENVTHQNN
jgi:hypothetical protein